MYESYEAADNSVNIPISSSFGMFDFSICLCIVFDKIPIRYNRQFKHKYYPLKLTYTSNTSTVDSTSIKLHSDEQARVISA